MEQLMSILGSGASTLEARQLLFKAGGDIARALNLHYDAAAQAGEQQFQLPAEANYLYKGLFTLPVVKNLHSSKEHSLSIKALKQVFMLDTWACRFWGQARGTGCIAKAKAKACAGPFRQPSSCKGQWRLWCQGKQAAGCKAERCC